MRKLLFLLISLVLFSCEMHTQRNIVSERPEAKIVDLNAIESLLNAVYKDDYFKIKNILSEANFELNVPSENGKLLLNEAIKSERLLIGSLLVSEGADPNVSTDDGINALKLIESNTLKKQWNNIFTGLGISKDYSEEKFFTLISQAAQDTQDDVIGKLSILIEIGADLRASDERGITYLMIASSNSLIKVVNFLCTFSEIDPNIVVEVGRGRRARKFSAYSLAQDADTKRALISCGAKP